LEQRAEHGPIIDIFSRHPGDRDIRARHDEIDVEPFRLEEAFLFGDMKKHIHRFRRRPRNVNFFSCRRRAAAICRERADQQGEAKKMLEGRQSRIGPQ